MNPGLLFFGGLIFVFCVWIYTGGPSHPISFAGPYLTPITNLGQVQTGYGKGESFISAPSGTYGTGKGYVSYKSGSQSGSTADTHQRLVEIQQQVNTLQAYGVSSPYRGQVRISSVSSSYQSQNVRGESITLSASQNKSPIDITGWRLVNANGTSNVVIPQAERFPSGTSRSSFSDIVLDSGQRAVISSGSSPTSGSYLENMCTGYFTSGSRSGYTTSNNSCPSPQSELSKFYTGSASEYQRCADYVSSIQTCSQPTDSSGSYGSNRQDVPNSCLNFARTTLTYSGCIAGHQNDANFFGNTWDVFLDKNSVLWRTSGDTIKLLDREGKTVDVYTY